MNQGVRHIIDQRKNANSKPGERLDGAKVGLVIEGGGMRGVVSAGMVAGLEALGYRDVFDGVYGSSAGAINGAYFVTGQARYGTTIYYQCIANKKFLNPMRALSGRPVMSLEYLLDNICQKQRLLNWKYAISSDVPLTVVASSLDKVEPVYMRSFCNPEDLREALRASARIPLISGAPVVHRGQRLWDALVFEPIPVRAALKDGCSHVVVLLTRPKGLRKEKPNFIDVNVFSKLIGREEEAIVPHYLDRYHKYNDLLDQIYANTLKIEGMSIDCAAISVPEQPPISGNCTQSETLRSGAADGMLAVYEFFSASLPQIVDVLTPFPAIFSEGPSKKEKVD